MSTESEEWQQLLRDFLTESREILETLSFDILTLESSPGDAEILHKLFRNIHTIKGSAGFLGFKNLSKFGHKLEDLLGKLRRQELFADSSVIDLLLIACDQLKDMVALIREKQQDVLDVGALSHKIDLLLTLPQSLDQKALENKPVPSPLSSEAPLKGEEQKNDSAKLGEILIRQKAIRPEELEEALTFQEQIPKLGEILVQKNYVTPYQLEEALVRQNKNKLQKDATIRVDVERLDALMNLVGELVLCRNQFYELAKSPAYVQLPESAAVHFSETIHRLAYNTGELQRAVMKTRMLPIARLFSRVPRLIRDLEQKTGKQVRLEIKGEETELDKTILEEMADPLMHMVRNAVDHGLETQKERGACGKDKTGTIRLNAFHEGSQILIEVEDDGRGIDREAVLQKALEKKLIPEDQAKRMTDQEILDLIFYPGLTTLNAVSDLSGRGVGLDVVKTSVSRLKGIIEVQTRKNQGALFRIKLPLTLAIIPVLLIGAADQIYALPLGNVVESLRILKEEICFAKGQKVIEFRGHVLPLQSFREIYGLPGEEEAEAEDKTPWIYLVVIGLGEKQKAIRVDALYEQEEVVIKSLTRFLSDVPGFAGGAVRGDGKVILIADIEFLITEQGGKSGANTFQSL